MRKLKTIHAGLTAQIERGGIAGAANTGGFTKKPRRPSSKPAAKRPSTAKRPSIDPKDHHNISGFISSASATAGGFSISGVKEYSS